MTAAATETNVSCFVQEEQPKKKIQRLRTGCWTCRRRGYKCDEGKPHCNNCVRLNIACEGYGIRLKWEEDRKPRRVRKSKRVSKSNTPTSAVAPTSGALPSPPIQEKCRPATTTATTTSNILLGSPIVFPESVPSSLGPDYSLGGTGGTEPFLDTSSSSPLSPNHSPRTPSSTLYDTTPLSSPCSKCDNPTVKMANIDGTEKLLLNHFTNVMSSELSVLSSFSNINIYREIMCPLYDSNEALRYALCGLSARQLAQYYPEYTSMSVEFKLEALKSLRQKLITSELDLPSLSTIVTLALHEAYEGNGQIWKAHIEGAVQGILCGNNSILSKSVEDKNVRRLLYVLEYHNIMSSLVSGSKPALCERFTLPWNLEGRKGADNAFLASVGPLYRAVASISSMAYDLNNASVFYASNSSIWPCTVLHGVQDIQYVLSIWTPCAGMQPDSENTALALKYATCLYFGMRMDINELSGAEVGPKLKQLVAQGLNALKKTSLQSSCNVFHPWPLWQLGIMCEHPDDQQFIMSRLQQLKSNSNKQSLQTIIDFLSLFWSYRKNPNYSLFSIRQLLQLTYTQSPLLVLC